MVMAQAAAVAGAVLVLAQRAFRDPPTAAIASLAVLWRFKVPESLLVLAGGLVGLALWQVGR
jgi:hypothetical protein